MAPLSYLRARELTAACAEVPRSTTRPEACAPHCEASGTDPVDPLLSVHTSDRQLGGR